MTDKRICFIIHGNIRNKEKLSKLLEEIFEGYQTSIENTSYPGHAITLATMAVTAGHSHIVCVGGDGSLNEVVNGMMSAKEQNPELELPLLAVLPRGRGNDFARMFNITADLSLLKKNIDAGHYHEIDLGVARYAGRESGILSRYYVNITDIGMGGVIAQKLSSYPSWMGAWGSYQRAIVTTLINYRPQQITVTHDGMKTSMRIMNLVVANGKYFGNGMGIAPEAKPNDGLLSVVTIGNISIIDYLKLLGEVKKARKLNHSEISYFSTREIHIESDSALPIDMDGEFVGYAPLTIHVIPKAIRFIGGLANMI